MCENNKHIPFRRSNDLRFIAFFLLQCSIVLQTHGQGGNHFSGNSVGHNYLGGNSALYGRYISYNGGTGGDSGSNNSMFGIDAGINHETGDYNAYMGARTGSVNTQGNNNTFIGANAGLFDRGIKNTFVGSSVGWNSTNNLNSGDFNSYYGYQTGSTNYDGSFNSYFGSRIHDFRGASTSSFGYRSGGGATSTYFGADAGLISSSLRNTIFGSQAAKHHGQGGSIFLGHEAGLPESIEEGTLSSLLYIHNEASELPLIYGEFFTSPLNGGTPRTPLLRINGKFEALGGAAGSSDHAAKEAVQEIDIQIILNHIRQMDISEWQYKDYPGERHIGPMAQEFFAAFGLGKNDTTISSMDADGVILAGIQALYQRNKKLQNEISNLSRHNAKIILQLKKQENDN